MNVKCDYFLLIQVSYKWLSRKLEVPVNVAKQYVNSLIECRTLLGEPEQSTVMTLLSMDLRLKGSVCIMSNVCMWYHVC